MMLDASASAAARAGERERIISARAQTRSRSTRIRLYPSSKVRQKHNFAHRALGQSSVSSAVALLDVGTRGIGLGVDAKGAVGSPVENIDRARILWPRR